MRTFRNILLTLLLLATGVLVILPYLSATWAGYFALLSLGAWGLTLLDVVCLLALWRHKAWRNAFLIFLFANFVWIRHYLPLVGSRVSGIDRQVTLVSWNVDNFGGGYQRYDNLAPAVQLIKDQHPDIICLQERPHTNVMSWDSIRAAFSDYPYVVKNTREDEVLNLVVFSRYPLSSLEEQYFEDTYNKYLSIDVDIAGQTVRLFNVHLQTTGVGEGRLDIINNARKRSLQAKMLEEAVAQSPHPVIVCGDFNDTRASYAYRTLARHLRDVAAAGSGWQGTYQPFGSLLKIDHILCSPAFHLQDYTVVSNPYSDHKLQKAIIII